MKPPGTPTSSPKQGGPRASAVKRCRRPNPHRRNFHVCRFLDYDSPGILTKVEKWKKCPQASTEGPPQPPTLGALMMPRGGM